MKVMLVAQFDCILIPGLDPETVGIVSDPEGAIVKVFDVPAISFTVTGFPGLPEAEGRVTVNAPEEVSHTTSSPAEAEYAEVFTEDTVSTPIGPIGPVAPIGPVGPKEPVGPIEPVGPAGPVVPGTNITPGSPVGQVPVGQLTTVMFTSVMSTATIRVLKKTWLKSHDLRDKRLVDEKRYG